MRIDIPMPKAGLTMVEGTISEWKVSEGALIQKGDAIMEYENEKNTIEYESVHGGYLHILEAAGETVEVGRPIAWVTETREEYDALMGGGAPDTAAAPAPAASPAPPAAPVQAAAAAETVSQGQRRVRATGLARKMAREAGVDLRDVPAGSGPDGRRIAARDVTAYLEYPNGATGVFVTTTADAPGTNRLEITMEMGKLVCEGGRLLLYRLGENERTFCRTSKEGFAKPECTLEEVETDGCNEQHVGVLKAFAARILHGTPLVAEGTEGIRGLTLSNAMHLSSWLDRTVEIPFDEELFLEELNKRRATSRKKTGSGVVFDTAGTY